MLARADSELSFKEALEEALLSFRCAQDTDIETFLRDKAIFFYKKKLCSVYLLLNEERFNNGKLKVDAYFTLSHKNIISATVGTSKSNIRKVTGGFDKKDVLEFVLIGQLGKYVEKLANDTFARADISGQEILDKAFETMELASQLIPSRCALVECNDNPKVRKVYEDYGFKFFQNDGTHNQYYKII